MNRRNEIWRDERSGTSRGLIDRWLVRIATARARFAHFPRRSLNLETRVCPGVESNLAISPLANL